MKKGFLSRWICGVLVIMMILLSACSAKSADTLTFYAMDTVISLSVYGGEDSCAKIREKAHELDGELSAVDEKSGIYALNRDGSAVMSEEAIGLIERSLRLSREMEGYFDITVYPAVKEWGFTTGEYNVPDDERLKELAEQIDFSAVRIEGDTISLPEGYAVDLGAIAKGHLADKAKEILVEDKVDGAVLNLGGTVLLYGKKPDGSDFKVGIADPENTAAYFGYLRLGEGVVATSGGYERYFEKDGKRYIHILDPKTAKPVDNGVLSVTVFCAEGAKADALSTALFVMGKDMAEEYYREKDGFEYVLLTDGGELLISEGLSDSFSLNEAYNYDIKTIKRDKG